MKKFFFIILKIVINISIFIYALTRFTVKEKESHSSIPVFMSIKKGHLMIAYLSMCSFSRMFGDAEFYVVIDYKSGILEKLVLQMTDLHVTVVSESDFNAIEQRLQNYKWAKAFYHMGWQGKKFFVPLLYSKESKIIVLDSDILFYRYPFQLNKWWSSNQKSLFMEDCGNYSVVSSIEAASILKRKTHLHNLNCGFMGINLRSFWKSNSLEKINNYIKGILEIENDRQIIVNRTNIPYGFEDPLIEQTLYWLTLDTAGAYLLNRDYFLYSKHKLHNEKIEKPVCIHFAGEIDKKSLYIYLFISLSEWICDKVFRKLANSNPWYSYSSHYCYNCKYGTNHMGPDEYRGPPKLSKS